MVLNQNSFISYVTINGPHYIVKQKKNSTRKIEFVGEALASSIAQNLDMAQLSKLFLSIENIAGKMYIDMPATLHTIAEENGERFER